MDNCTLCTSDVTNRIINQSTSLYYNHLLSIKNISAYIAFITDHYNIFSFKISTYNFARCFVWM